MVLASSCANQFVAVCDGTLLLFYICRVRRQIITQHIGGEQRRRDVTLHRGRKERTEPLFANIFRLQVGG